MPARPPKGWREGRLKDLCENVERRLGDASKLEVLSVAKRGVVPQSQTYDKEIASEDISRYRVIEPGEFGPSSYGSLLWCNWSVLRQGPWNYQPCL